MLKDIFVYDDSEPSNTEAFKNLPSFFQSFINDFHIELRNTVYKIFDNTKYKPVFTSGFRSAYVNKKVGGSVQSLHLHGLAVDFVVATRLGETLIDTQNIKKFVEENFNKLPDSHAFTLIFERTHFHFQFNRKL